MANRNHSTSNKTQFLPPHDFEAEQAVLGACLISKEAIKEVFSELSPSDFYRDAHRKIARAILSLWKEGEPVDYLTVKEVLERRGELEEVGGITYLEELVDIVPTAATVGYHIGVVKELSVRRRVIEALNELSEWAYDRERSIEELVEGLEATKEEVMGKVSPPPTVSAKELQNDDLPDPEWLIGGLLPRGGLFLLCGRPKTGKSFLALDLASSVAVGGKGLGALEAKGGEVLYIALEDGRRRIKERLKALFPEGEEWPSSLEFAFEWPPLDRGGLIRLRRALEQKPRALVVIDPLGRLRSPVMKGDIYTVDLQLLGGLQDLAKETNTSILVVHHLRKAKGEDPLEEVLGTTGFTASSDVVGILKKERGEGKAELFICGGILRRGGSRLSGTGYFVGGPTRGRGK